MAKQAKKPKEKFIPLSIAARKYGTSEQNVLNLTKNGKITTVPIGNTYVIDENSLLRYFEKNKKISDYDKRLDELLREREELIIGQENELLLLYSFQDLNSFIPLILSEFSLLIKDKTKRNIFIQVSNTRNLNLVARKNRISVDKVRYYYKFAIKIIYQKLGFLKDFRETMAGLKFKIRELEIINQTKENEINRLLSILPSIERTEPEAITPEIVKLLSTPLCSLNFERRALNCFHWYDLHTVEDLLRLTKNNGFKTFIYYRSFGKKSLALLKAILIENNIIDADEDSYLYKFV